MYYRQRDRGQSVRGEEREERRERETFTLFSLYAVSHSGRVRVLFLLVST